jgi:hypothetical protein
MPIHPVRRSISPGLPWRRDAGPAIPHSAGRELTLTPSPPVGGVRGQPPGSTSPGEGRSAGEGDPCPRPEKHTANNSHGDDAMTHGRQASSWRESTFDGWFMSGGVGRGNTPPPTSSHSRAGMGAVEMRGAHRPSADKCPHRTCEGGHCLQTAHRETLGEPGQTSRRTIRGTVARHGSCAGVDDSDARASRENPGLRQSNQPHRR